MNPPLDRTRVVYHRGGLVWAVRDGQPAHIDDVPNGLACGCVCEDCGGALVARNHGQIRMPHFAHAAGQECGNTGEAGLARSAAQVLNATRELLVPPPPDESWQRPRLVVVEAATAVVERGKTPEVQVTARGRTLRLLVRPTDRTPAEIAATAAGLGVSTLQLEVRPDAAGVITLGTLADALADVRYGRSWLYNVRAAERAAAAAPPPRPPAPSAPIAEVEVRLPRVAESPPQHVSEPPPRTPFGRPLPPPSPAGFTPGEPGPRFCWRCGGITEFAPSDHALRCVQCATEFLG